jgi:hypothetical protein
MGFTTLKMTHPMSSIKMPTQKLITHGHRWIIFIWVITPIPAYYIAGIHLASDMVSRRLTIHIVTMVPRPGLSLYTTTHTIMVDDLIGVFARTMVIVGPGIMADVMVMGLNVLQRVVMTRAIIVKARMNLRILISIPLMKVSNAIVVAATAHQPVVVDM